ncbi:MAG TPA: MFS transporter [Terriglobales bacterium]|nr:MFS transporter [Terriglobales bacterium]
MLIFAAILAIFVYGMIAAMLGTILPDLSERFRLTPTQNGTIAFAQALGLMIASLAVGPLLDNEGDKIGILLGLVFIAVALIGLPRARGYASIVVLLFLLGVGGGIVVTGANALTSGVEAAHRATALNLVNLFFGLGGLATPFIAANLFHRNWVRLCYTIVVLTAIAAAVEISIAMPAPTPGSGFVLTQAGPILGRPLLFLLGFFLFLYISCEVGVWNWLARHLVAQGIAEQKALNILSLGFALGLLIGRVVVSQVLISVSPVVVLMGSSIAMTATTFLMLQTRRPAMAAAMVFVAGLAMAPVFPTTLAITGGAFPRMTGTALGFVITCGWAGLAVSSRIIGAIAGGDALRLRKALLVIPAFSLIMIGLNAAIWMALK